MRHWVEMRDVRVDSWWNSPRCSGPLAAPAVGVAISLLPENVPGRSAAAVTKVVTELVVRVP